MQTIIHTPYDCLIVDSVGQHYLDKNENFSVENPDKICVYPTGKSSLFPFCVNGFYSPFYHTVNKDNIRHVFLLDGPALKEIQVHHATFSGGSGEIEKHSDKIIFSSQAGKTELPLRYSYDEILIDSFFHIGYACLTSKAQNHLVFFNFKNGKTKTFEGEKITATPPDFEVVSQGQKNILTITKEGLHLKEKPNVIILENPLFPYLPFVQALKEENYSYCHTLLSDKLRENQTEQDIRSFFGQVQYYFPLSHNQVFILSHNKGEVFTFSYQQNKISDISTD